MFTLSESETVAIALSAKVALLSCLVALPFALALGYGLARHCFFGKSLVEGVLNLPLVMPPVTTGYLLLLVLGTRGLVGGWLYQRLGIRLPFSFAAAVIASTVVAFPLLVRSIRIAMELGQRGLEEASATLGAGPLRTFFQVTIPLALPGIVSGLILAFARSLGEFGATITFAGNIEGETRTLPLAIFNAMQIPGNEDMTLRLVVISVVIAFGAMVISEWALRRIKAS
jgi:molybdate transport system permease protein